MGVLKVMNAWYVFAFNSITPISAIHSPMTPSLLDCGCEGGWLGVGMRLFF
jgi:hypothetical protein